MGHDIKTHAASEHAPHSAEWEAGYAAGVRAERERCIGIVKADAWCLREWCEKIIAAILADHHL